MNFNFEPGKMYLIEYLPDNYYIGKYFGKTEDGKYLIYDNVYTGHEVNGENKFTFYNDHIFANEKHIF